MDTTMLEGLDAISEPLAVSTRPGDIEVTIGDRVTRLREEQGLREGSCNPPWSSWDS